MIKVNERTMLYLFASTLMLSAFLLFWVQPLIAKMILPYLGGSPAVWNTCMMFFQGILLCGYLYAHCSAKWLSKQWQVIVQVSLLLLGVMFLPFVIDSTWVLDSNAPISSLISSLGFKIGLPLLALSATNPLLQHWFSLSDHQHSKDPYFLYSASNIGSLLALLAFPFLLEPWLSTSYQNTAWRTGFIALLAFTIASSVGRITLANVTPSISASLNEGVSVKNRLSWLMLAFVPSSLLLGLTTYITTDIASAPLFWVIPLLLYLGSFIFVFARKPLWSLETSGLMQGVILLPFLYVFLLPSKYDHYLVVLLLHLVMFSCTALVCHGELVRQRPKHDHLTEYYLWMAFGGFLGGVFNSLVAPMVFNWIYEYPLVYGFALILCPPKVLNRFIATLIVIASALVFGYYSLQTHHNTVLRVRNFYGSVRVYQQDDFTLLSHGTTIHGVQNRQHPRELISYYGALKEIFSLLMVRNNSLTIATAGLGAGVTACITRPEDRMTFFEIDPQVTAIAKNPQYFSFLKLCPPSGGIVMGDARLSLEKHKNNYFDVIILDTFSSDAIPMHMMTLEAFELYLSKLKPNGIILVHISNRHLTLAPVLSAIASSLGVHGWLRDFDGDVEQAKYRAKWVMISRLAQPLSSPLNSSLWTPLSDGDPQYLWTDDYSNIVRVMIW